MTGKEKKISCFYELINVGSNFRRVFKKDELGAEIIRIALPAAMALAADPVASLIDTAFIGRLGLFSCPIIIHSANYRPLLRNCCILTTTNILAV